MSLGLIRTQ